MEMQSNAAALRRGASGIAARCLRPNCTGYAANSMAMAYLRGAMQLHRKAPLGRQWHCKPLHRQGIAWQCQGGAKHGNALRRRRYARQWQSNAAHWLSVARSGSAWAELRNASAGSRSASGCRGNARHAQQWRSKARQCGGRAWRSEGRAMNRAARAKQSGATRGNGERRNDGNQP